MVRKKVKISSDLKTTKKNYGLETPAFNSTVSAYLAERKFVRHAMNSLSPQEFMEVTGRKLKQVPGDHIALCELMLHEIEAKICGKDASKTIRLWKIACNEGIVKAIKSLFHEKSLHSRQTK